MKLGWTYSQYASLTQVQKAFVIKEIERQEVKESEALASAVETAIANSFRKRGRRRMSVWRKSRKGSPEQPVSEEAFSRLKAIFARKFKKKEVSVG